MGKRNSGKSEAGLNPIDNKMNAEDIKAFFCNTIKNNEDISVGVAAIRTLMKIITEYKYETLQDLDEKVKEGIEVMKNSNHPIAAISSGCELFLRFITLCRLDFSIEECKENMVKRGLLFLNKLDKTRDKIVGFASDFIKDGSKILTHSRSRVVLQTLRKAAEQQKRFEVYVTISQPDNSGERLHKELLESGISSTLILDSSIAYVMEQVDFVMVGAEGVVESGGIVNKVGSYTIAICAKAMNKPLYVLAESFKFSRLFPLNQGDLPDTYKYTSEYLNNKEVDLKKVHPLVDYTPPSYITLLFTDLGILYPSAVSDELIQLYL